MVNRSIAIGVLVAIVLSFIRGGITDSFTALAIFGLAGFSTSLFLHWILRIESIQQIENVLGQLPQSTFLRNAISLLSTLSLLIWSGTIIRNAGYSGWLLALLICFLAPLFICIIAPRFSVFYGVLTATCITCSLLLLEAQSEIGRGNVEYWSEFWHNEFPHWSRTWLVAIFLSLLISVPIQIQRRSAKGDVTTTNTALKTPFSRLPHSWYTLQNLTIVLVPLLMAFGATRLDRKLDRLRSDYLEKYNHHNAIVVELVEAEYGGPITTSSELRKLEKAYASVNPKISWHRDLSNKYLKAHYYPWLPVPPVRWSQEHN